MSETKEKTCPCCNKSLMQGRCAQCENKTTEQLYVELLEGDRDKYKKALEYIINSTECSTCYCKQITGKTYQGATFKFLQDYARKAIK